MAQFPNEIWNGTSEGRPEGAFRPPSAEDWDAVVGEVREVETKLFNQPDLIQGGPVGKIFDETGSDNASDLLTAVDYQLWSEAAGPVGDNFASIAAVLNSIITALRESGIISPSTELDPDYE